MLPHNQLCGTVVLPQSFRKLFYFSALSQTDWDDATVTQAVFYMLAAIKHAGTHEKTLLAAKQALAIIGEIDDEDFIDQLQEVDNCATDDLGGFSALFASMVNDGEIGLEGSIDIDRLSFDQQIRLKPIYNAARALSALSVLVQKAQTNPAVPAGCLILEALVLFLRHSLSAQASIQILAHWLSERGCTQVLLNTFSHFASLRTFSSDEFNTFNSMESVSAFAIWVIAHHKVNGIVLNRKAREACMVLLAHDFLEAR